MKKTILALVAALVAGSALATSQPVGTGTSYSGGVSVSGSISNTISTSASVGLGGGSSFSAAGMTSRASAVATVTTPVTTSADGTTTITGSIRGETYTLNNGYAYNVSSGSGAAGSASATGTAAAGALANLTTNALNCDPAEGTLTLTGRADSNTAVTIATSGINSGGYAGAEAGNTFDAVGKLALTVIPEGATIGGLVEDVKNSTSFANTASGAITFEGGTPEGFTVTAPTVLVGNATAVVNAVGSFSGFKDISGGSLPKCTTGDCDGGGEEGGSKPKGNNGLGNGDQPAPGNSLDNNGAENGSTGTHPGSGKPTKKD